MATDLDRLRDYEERYEQGNSKIDEFRQEARKDVEFFLNKQFSDREEAYLNQEGRECIVNNKLRRGIMLISGHQRMNQLSSVVIPQGKENQDTADLISNAVQWVYTKRDGYHHLSDCFLYGSLISGINFSEIMLDYSCDPENPDISFNRIPYNAAVWDPYFTKPDLSDCAYFIRRMLTSRAEVTGFLPDYASEIKKLKPFSGDGKFTDMPAFTNPTGQEFIAYDESWERCSEKRLVVLDARTHEFVGLIRKDMEKDAEKYISLDPYRVLVRRTIPTVKMSIILNGEIIDTVDDPLGINEYPFVAFPGIYIPEHDDFSLRLQSALRVGRDPQSEMNKRISKLLDIIDSKTHVGYIYKKKALADGEDVYKAGNFRNIAIKNDAVIGQDIAPIVPTPTDPSIIQAMQLFDQNIMDTLGITDASFGTPQGGNDSGLLTMLRQESSIVGLQPFFDNFNRCQYYHTRKVIKAMQVNWPDWKWERVTGKKVSLGIRDTSFMKFDAHVTQGILTENQQKMFYAQLFQLRQMGVESITDAILIKYAPMQDSGTLQKEIQATEQQKSQAMQQQQQIQMQQMQLANQKTMSEIEENKSDSVRQNARAIADIGLTSAHIAEATQKRAAAALDMVRASQEMQSEDQRQLIEAMQFIDSIMNRKLQQNSEQLLLDKAVVDQYRQPSQQELQSIMPQQEALTPGMV